MDLPVEQMLVGDGDRQDADGRLQRAVGDGFLTLLECDERARAAWGARTRSQLARVTADLPSELPVDARADRLRRVRALLRGNIGRVGLAAGLAALLKAGLPVAHRVVDRVLGEEPSSLRPPPSSLLVHQVGPDQRRLDLDQFTEEARSWFPTG